MEKWTRIGPEKKFAAVVAKFVGYGLYRVYQGLSTTDCSMEVVSAIFCDPGLLTDNKDGLSIIACG